ncbi:MAG TPA: sce7726 family protein [Lactovum miscens]|uniref:sce7726 family protein n=1 Tax=Lactovum miscens TaxID=190387 RepID=UPI002ED8C527
MNNNFVLNRVFSQKMVKELIRDGSSALLNNGFEKYFGSSTEANVNTKIQSLYSILEKSYRNEYFFKNTLLNKILLGKHSLNTTTALSEVWLNRSKADLVLLNGKAVVYEIKTELDNLDRLDQQLIDYYKVFGNVEIVTDESHLDRINNKYLNTSVGILLLTNRKTISVVKKSNLDLSNLEYLSMYKLLRKEEKINILTYFYDILPAVDQFSEYDVYFNLFNKIPLPDLYLRMLKELKMRDKKIVDNSSYFVKSPFELRSLLYFNPLKIDEYIKLEKIIEET